MMKKYFDPMSIEQNLYEFWEKNGYFKPNGRSSKSSFCIVIPPPNVTGNLHIGHAFQQTIMDILVRYNRMQGKNTLWQVGTDHAGIATQIMVEKKVLEEEKKTIREYSRTEFLGKIWKWKNESHNMITNQMRRLGISVDWTKERFTLDSKISNSVREVFIMLYKENLIYRRKKLVNWDPILGTVISDLEVENRNLIGNMWYIKYFLTQNDIQQVDKKKYIIVATTRPETLLGDTAIAVHPDDFRYKKYIGRTVLVPIINRIIPIISDEFVDREKGTGFVKITPAHDFNDYEVAIRHKLPVINILTKDGNISDTIDAYDVSGNKIYLCNEKIPLQLHHLNRFLARTKIIDILMSLEMLDKVEEHNLVVPHGERSGAIIEPLLTNQWYLNIKLLAKTAIRSVKLGDISFIPKKYENIYYSWMNNIQDWCISRQLLWGHQIPIWYDSKKNIYVGRNEEEVRKEYCISNNISLIQEDDVLDTWFSSSLWVLSSLGWPNKINLLKNFYPTDVIVSGFDIIFFWIARMIMLSMHVIKDHNGKGIIPFKKIYITGLICDEYGQKMSKSKGNVIDPLDMIQGISLDKLIKKRTKNTMFSKFSDKEIRIQTKILFPNGINSSGTDALRFTCAALSTPTRHVKWNMNRLYGYRNFCNKLWNASRFVLMNIDKKKKIDLTLINQSTSLSDQWILTLLNDTIRCYRDALDNYRFDIAANILYDFIWNKFCDIYIELVKSFINSCSDLELRSTQSTLVYVLESLLRLAHPIIPFITEEIWQKLKIVLTGIDQNTIMLRSFPKFDIKLVNLAILEDMKWIKNVFSVIKNFRINMKISYKTLISVLFKNVTLNTNKLIQKYKNYIQKIAYISKISIISSNDIINSELLFKSYIIPGAELLISYSKLHSQDTELKNLDIKISKIKLEINQLEKKFKNKEFMNRAPHQIIEKYQKKLKFYKEQEYLFCTKKSKIL